MFSAIILLGLSFEYSLSYQVAYSFFSRPKNAKKVYILMIILRSSFCEPF